MRRYLFTILLFFLMPLHIFADTLPLNTSLGHLTLSSRYLSINQSTLPIYNVFSQDYIAVFSLATVGFDVKYDATTNTTHVMRPTTSLLNTKPDTDDLWTTSSLEGQSFQIFDGSIYIGNMQTHGIVSNNRVLVPIETLLTLGNLHKFEQDYFYTYAPAIPIRATATSLINDTTSPALIFVADVYWEGRWITRTNSYHLAPYQTLNRNAKSPYGNSYVASIITGYSADSTTQIDPQLMGQFHTALFEYNDRAKTFGDLSQLGDPISLDQAIAAEDTIRSMNLTSKTPYLVWTHIGTQHTYIFENRNNQWHLLKYFICSTGKPSTPTPKGTYELTRKVPYFGVEKGYRCKNAFGFIGTKYLYHSILFDKTGSYLLEGKGVLGTQASDGCIRFSPENAVWFYDTMLSGTKVFID